jgi:hypothetical protein
VSDEIRLITSEDPAIIEEWLRETDEPNIRGVSACRIEDTGSWQVTVCAMEFVRGDPLETELRQRVITALRTVGGVTGAQEQDRETWFLTGNPSGRALILAAAEVVDDLAERTRAYYNSLFGRTG